VSRGPEPGVQPGPRRPGEPGALSPPPPVPEEPAARTEDGRVVADDGALLRRRLGSLVDHPELDDWVSFSEPGRITVRTGKVELGQGILTALAVVASEELVVSPERVEVVRATTGTSPDEGFTAGSRSVEQSGAAVRQACAHAYQALLRRAAARLGADTPQLEAVDGIVRSPDGAAVSYWELAAEGLFHCRITEPAPLRATASRRWVGRGIPRRDLPAKISGGAAYVQDLRLPGMRFARVLRPPRPGATLSRPVPPTVGEAEVVRAGSFLAVVAATEGEAEAAADILAPQLSWQGGEPFASDAADPAHMAGNIVASYPIVGGKALDGRAVESHPPDGHPPDGHTSRARALEGEVPGCQLTPECEPGAAGATVVRARYTKPFLLHASIGPSGAVALFEEGSLTVWSHSQGIGFLGKSLADVLALSREAVTVHHLDGAGCYGHNGADDAALDAAVVAMAHPGEAISLRWSRADEHRFEPLGPAMVVDLAADLGADGKVRSWGQDILTYRHNSRPLPQQRGSRLLASWSFDPPVERARASPMLDFEAGGHRNGTPAYHLGTTRIVKHDVDDRSPLRTSAMRSLGALGNVFAIESFMDELAAAAGADPVAFRLAHLDDPRARTVIESVVDLAGGLGDEGRDDTLGRGLGFAQYENSMAYVAVVVEVEVPARTAEVALRRAWIVCDAGEVIDPDGLENQIEGGCVQAASWTLKEAVELGPDGVSNVDWESYPILRFSDIPVIRTQLIDRPDCPPLGAGEASCGPTAGAIANAVFRATGVRVRDLPLRPARIQAAFDALL
jgi:nicotinate dehydrogenase subunit B